MSLNTRNKNKPTDNNNSITGEINNILTNTRSYLLSLVVFIVLVAYYLIIVIWQTNSTDFLIYILYLVALIAFTIYIFYIIFNVPDITNQVMNNKIVQIFTIIFFISFVFKMTALSLFITVFDYARNQLKDTGYDSGVNSFGKDTGYGYTVRKEYQDTIASSMRYENYTTIFYLAFAYLLYSNQLGDNARKSLNYVVCFILACIILFGSSLLLYNGISILSVKKNGDVLYLPDPHAST